MRLDSRSSLDTYLQVWIMEKEAGAQTTLDVVHLGSQHGDKSFRIDQYGDIVLLDYFIKLALRRDEVKDVAVV